MTSALIVVNVVTPDREQFVLVAFVLPLSLPLVRVIIRAPHNIIAMVPFPHLGAAFPSRWSLSAQCAIPPSVVSIPPLVLMAFVLVLTPNQLVELVLCLLPPLL